MSEIKKHFDKTAWFEDDPRWHINKRNKIIILYNDAEDSNIFENVTIADVETKNSWSIWPMDLEWVSADDDWPKGWVWTYLPTRKEV